MKIKYVVLISFILALFLFHKPILGRVARVLLKSQFDCDMVYRSLKWDDGNLVFSEVVLFDSSFHAHIQKATLLFDWSDFPHQLKGHIAIDRPHISVMKKRELPQMEKGWFDFTVSVFDGILEWDGPAQFSFNQNHLELEWDDASLSCEFENSGIEADFKDFKISLLKNFFPYAELTNGRLTGRVHAGSNQNLTAANVKIADLALQFPTASIGSGTLTLSYNADVGAKWEIQGEGTVQEKAVPFSCKGRGFFKSHWLESEVHFDSAVCKVSGEDVWHLECHELQAEQATLLQACALPFFPDLAPFTFSHGKIDAEADIFPSSWQVRFVGHDLGVAKDHKQFSCKLARGELSQDGGSLVLSDEKFDLRMAGSLSDWSADLRLLSTECSLKGGWDGEKFAIEIEKGKGDHFTFTGSGWLDLHFDLTLQFDGIWSVAERKIPFYCPRLTKIKDEWSFDFRLKRETWDWLRMAGQFDGHVFHFSKSCHLLGSPLQCSSPKFGDFEVATNLEWHRLLAADPLLKEAGLDLKKIPVLGETALHFSYRNGAIAFDAKGSSFPFDLNVREIGRGWKIDLQSDLNLDCTLQKDGILKGKGAWKEEAELEFDGKIAPNFRCEFALSNIRFNLHQIPKIEGNFEGQGHVIYDGNIESDFDLTASSLKINSQAVENEGPIHLYYSSLKGALLTGINLHGPIDCVVDLLEYDANRLHWIFHNAHVHLPGSFFAHPLLKFLDQQQDLNFTADLNFASDFSKVVCTMREGVIPFRGAAYQVENLQLAWDNRECLTSLTYLEHLIRLRLKIDDQISGRLILGDEKTPLAIDWEYENGLIIQSIEGSFCGVDANFHSEKANTLVGSAHVDFKTIRRIIPDSVAEVFEEIKMGKGYELKGRLKFENNLPYFKGILSGKQLELFGFQFRTLLAQVDLGPERLKIYDVKISDTAGVMKIDEILMEGKNEQPWTIAIPTLTMIDLRPSLLLRPGGTVGPISPLVVRELKITDFKGLLDEGKTWTADGKLHFINSYKREETVFDLPANVLSRIVGLDLELLIPVRGDLNFNLKDGYFNLLELTDAFSEAERSEFFLESNPPPRMDLDGNLEIFIKMKQFVLLKITESFLISIDGKLDDPQFRLKRRRFFGLMCSES